jgi:hypothetical protein
MEAETTYEIIADYSTWGRGRQHVSREHGTVETLCGRSLGFNYSPATVSGRENDEPLLLSAADISARPNTCKSCMMALNKGKTK